jgi:uncharacterized protein YpmS
MDKKRKITIITLISISILMLVLGGFLLINKQKKDFAVHTPGDVIGAQTFTRDNICEIVNSQMKEDFDFNDMKDYPMPFKVTLKDIQVFMKMYSSMKTACEDNKINSDEEAALEAMIDELSPEIQEQIEAFRED